MKRENYFSGFENKPAHYEDNLTRAFLVLLRLVPPVQAAFIDAVRDVQLARGDHEVVPPRTAQGSTVREVRTQVGTLSMQEGRVVSILLNSSEWHPEAPVAGSDRTAVYDGVIHYGERWVLVVENKPYGDVREAQLSPNLGGTEGLEVEPLPVVLVWKDLIARLHGLAEGGWLGVTEALLLDDFLRYVQSEFKWLNPYPTLAACGGDLALLNHRCTTVMGELVRDPERIAHHPGGGHYLDAPELGAAHRIILSVEEVDAGWNLLLRIYPGDTVTQARSFYGRVDAGAFHALTEKWDCKSNLHFSHINKHLHWARAHVEVGPFVEFWLQHQEWIRKVKESEFGALCAMLTEQGMMDERDREAFGRLFIESNRSTVNVCPGVGLYYRWPEAEAVRLDGEGRLKSEVDRRVREAARTWSAEDAWSAVIAAQ